MTEVDMPLLCGGCGNRYPENTLFCSGCGRVLGEENEIKDLADSVRPNNEPPDSLRNMVGEDWLREMAPINSTTDIPEYCGVCGGNSELCVCVNEPKPKFRPLERM